MAVRRLARPQRAASRGPRRHPARLSAPPPALRRGPRLAARCGPASRLTDMRPVGRQPGLDTDSPALCGYATEPRTRPDCGLTPVVAFDATRLCASCAARRSTLGKGQRPRPLQAPAVDVLTWLARGRARPARRSPRPARGGPSLSLI